MKITHLLIALIVVGTMSALLLLADKDDSEDEGEDPIATALVALSQRTNEDAFVIFRAAPTGKRVQFSVRNVQSVYFHFPVLFQSIPSHYSVLRFEDAIAIPPGFAGSVDRILTDDEEDRLKVMLDDLGLDYEENIEAGRTPDGEIVAYMKSIRGDLDVPESEYSSFVLDVFGKVYRITDAFELEIEEN